MMWVDGTDLNQWANRREAQSTIPQVVRRLILATCSCVKRLDFRAGDGVHLSGWDGIAEVDQGNAFAPEGFLAWEFGANKNVKSKADHEYQTRTDNPGDANPLETIYIFVTPRRWGNKSKWAETKNKEGIWKEVRAYDADDIEAWLETAPPVHVWLSRLIGKIPPNVVDLEAFWHEWSNATSPRLSPSLVLSGRQQISEQITTWLQENAKALFLKADSSEEALAILAATVETLSDNLKITVYSRALIVDNETSWRHLALGNKNFILIPRFSSVSGLQGAVQNENHVFVPLGRDANVSTNATEV